jgi:predicted O-methyltransferase YrrM
MLEKIGPGAPTISTPAKGMAERIEAIVATNPSACIAEIGVGIGATTLSLAKAMNNRGQLHIFDFQESVDELKADLAALGFQNVVAHGNTHRHWDSYHWSLANLLSQRGGRPLFDFIYLDGSHLLIHDLPAFVLADKLLKKGGMIEFDDYSWRWTQSNWMRDVRPQYVTDEQAGTPQVKMLVDLFVKTNPRYRTISRNRLYQKRGSVRTLWRALRLDVQQRMGRAGGAKIPSRS